VKDTEDISISTVIQNSCPSQRKILSARSHKNVFDRLYSSATFRHVQEKLNEITHNTIVNEPRTKTDRYNKKARGVSERLSYSNKKERLRYLEDKKMMLELQHCTFAPDLPHLKNWQPRTPRKEPSYNKLMEALKKARENYNSKELKERTFKPQIKQNNETNKSTYERLYNDYQRRNTQARRNELNYKEALVATCTFKPTITSKSRDTDKDTTVHDKLYLEYKKKLLLEQKRQELENEAKRMSQTIKTLKKDECKRLYEDHKNTAAKREELVNKVFKVY